MDALSCPSYKDNLLAVGSVAVKLRQSVAALQQGIAELMGAAGETRRALNVAEASILKANSLILGLQAVFKKADLDVGQSEWELCPDVNTNQVAESISKCHGVVNERFGVCSSQMDQLMSLVGKQLLVVNFSEPELGSTPSVLVDTNSSPPHLEARLDAESQIVTSSSLASSAANNSDYSEDVAVVKASLLDSGSAPQSGDLVLEGSPFTLHDTSSSPPSSSVACRADPRETGQNSLDVTEKRKSRSGHEASSSSPTRDLSSPKSSAKESQPDVQAAAFDWTEPPHLAPNVVNEDVQGHDIADQVGKPVKPSPHDPKNSETASQSESGGLMFFETTPSPVLSSAKKKPRLSSDGLKKRGQTKIATVESNSPATKSRIIGRKPLSKSAKDLCVEGSGGGPSDKLESQGRSPLSRMRSIPARRSLGPGSSSARKVRQSTDESGDEKTASPGRFRRGRTLSSSPQGRGPRSLPSKSNSSSKLPTPGTSTSGAATTNNSTSSARPQGFPTSPDVRHLIAVKEGSSSLGLRICGGRGLGVFVDNVAAGSAASECGMRQGDQILKFGDRDFEHVTHCAAGHSMLGLSGEIHISVKHNMKGYESLPKRQDSQDNFYARSRCSRPLEIKKNVQDLPLNPGDVFLVVETLPKSHEDCWKAHQVNITTGAVKDKTGFIPSRRRLMDAIQRASAADTEGALTLEAVTFQKYDFPRPVVLLGPPQVVAAMRSNLLKDFEKVFCACPVYDVIGQTDMASRPDVILLTSIHDSKRQTYVYRTSVEQAAEKGLHCLLDVTPMDIPAMIAAGQHPIVILLLKNKSVVAAKEEYGLSWLYTGNLTLSSVVRRDCQSILRIVQEQQKCAVWVPHASPLTDLDG